MTRKRTSLEALLREAAEPQPASAMPAPSVRPGRRPGVRQQTVYLPIPIYEQLRRLAFEERVKMHTLLMEGLDRVFRDRGLPSIAELRARRE
ncbi:MAG: hypothetical protein KatS3mg082_2480 [Nitrospiraceae bacterium]|jgi:hypothetical protein|nr:MAG: hypothetical protein KatS3mg082_2480 [Nitrospiraceae bacterium]